MFLYSDVHRNKENTKIIINIWNPWLHFKHLIEIYNHTETHHLHFGGYPYGLLCKYSFACFYQNKIIHGYFLFPIFSFLVIMYYEQSLKPLNILLQYHFKNGLIFHCSIQKYPNLHLDIDIVFMLHYYKQHCKKHLFRHSCMLLYF